MEDVTVSHAKEHLEELIERAARGEVVRISDPRLGTVKLQSVTAVEAEVLYPQRVPGQWQGRFAVPARLFEPLSEDELARLSGEQSP